MGNIERPLPLARAADVFTVVALKTGGLTFVSSAEAAFSLCVVVLSAAGDSFNVAEGVDVEGVSSSRRPTSDGLAAAGRPKPNVEVESEENELCNASVAGVLTV